MRTGVRSVGDQTGRGASDGGHEIDNVVVNICSTAFANILTDTISELLININFTVAHFFTSPLPTTQLHIRS